MSLIRHWSYGIKVPPYASGTTSQPVSAAALFQSNWGLGLQHILGRGHISTLNGFYMSQYNKGLHLK